MFPVFVLAVDYGEQNYVTREGSYLDTCDFVAEDDPHVCETQGDAVFCPYALYLPESGLYQCRTSPGSYLIAEKSGMTTKLLGTSCPNGQALQEGTRTCIWLNLVYPDTVLYSTVFSTTG